MMKIQWPIFFVLLPLLVAACGDDENDVFDGYHGSSEMTRDLQVDWGEAATKSVAQITTQFVSSGSSFLNKEIRWAEDSTNIEVVTQDGVMADMLTQLEAAEVLIDNYKRTQDSNVLSVIQNVINGIYTLNGNSYISDDNTVTASMGLVSVRLYEATGNDVYWTAAKEVFNYLEEVGNIDITAVTEDSDDTENEETTSTNDYTNGRYGIPVSEEDTRRTITVNAKVVMMSANMYLIATSLNETSDIYYNFADNVFLFCESALYESTGLVYTSAYVGDNGTYEDQDTNYSSANQGYMLGACVAIYHMYEQNGNLEYANTIAQYQVDGTNNDNVWHQNYAVFYPSYGTGKIGTQDRVQLLNHGIFFRYLASLLNAMENDTTVSGVANKLSYQLCLTNNVETMWELSQNNENCLWGATWYQPAYAGEYSDSSSDEWASKTVISLEAQTASSALLEMKAGL